MGSPDAPRIVELHPEATYDLRQRVLRQGMPDTSVEFPEDQHPGALHLGVAVGDDLVAVASFWPEPAPVRPRARAARLRGMAVDPAWQRRGLGRLLMAAASDLLANRGFEVLWANARDTALDFYERMGMDVVGEGFVSVGLPHHVVVRDLGVGAEP